MLTPLRKVRRGSYRFSRRLGDILAIFGGPATIAHRLKNKFIAKRVMGPKLVGRVWKYSPFKKW